MQIPFPTRHNNPRFWCDHIGDGGDGCFTMMAPRVNSFSNIGYIFNLYFFSCLPPNRDWVPPVFAFLVRLEITQWQVLAGGQDSGTETGQGCCLSITRSCLTLLPSSDIQTKQDPDLVYRNLPCSGDWISAISHRISYLTPPYRSYRLSFAADPL